jgi:hypothetical protein
VPQADNSPMYPGLVNTGKYQSQQVDEKRGLQAAQKELEPWRAKHKDESGNLKAEFSFQLS